MVNAAMKRVILESQVSRDLTGNIISWIRSFRQTFAVQFDSKSKQSDWLLKIRSNLIAYWLNGVTALGKTRVAFVYKINPGSTLSNLFCNEDIFDTGIFFRELVLTSFRFRSESTSSPNNEKNSISSRSRGKTFFTSDQSRKVTTFVSLCYGKFLRDFLRRLCLSLWIP